MTARGVIEVPTAVSLYVISATIACPPSPISAQRAGAAFLRGQRFQAGPFFVSGTHVHPVAGDLNACVYTRPVDGGSYAVTSARVSIRPAETRLDAPTEVSTKTGSRAPAALTGFAVPPFTRLDVRVRPGETPCRSTPLQEQSLPGSQSLALQPVAEQFTSTMQFGPRTVGPHRVCAYLVDPATAAVGTMREAIWQVGDGVPPQVEAVESFATAGRAGRIWFRVTDDGGPAAATVSVIRANGSLLATIAARPGADGRLRSVAWRAPARLQGRISFCVEARDGGGNEGMGCAPLIVRRHWPCGEPTPTRRAGRCETPATVPRGASAAGFVRCGVHGGVPLTARWTTCANARSLHTRFLRGASVSGWSCSRPLRQCVAPWPRESYVLWR